MFIYVKVNSKVSIRSILVDKFNSGNLFLIKDYEKLYYSKSS